MDFSTPEYLASGKPKQQKLYDDLTATGILDRLYSFDPVVAGTIPIGIDTELSDVDILCYSPPERFTEVLSVLDKMKREGIKTLVIPVFYR